jgi:hypothetical protein
MKIICLGLLSATIFGCSIINKSDKFGADLEFKVGGILSYIVDLHFKSSVGFSKTCKENDDGKDETMVNSDPFGLRDFL